MKRKKGDMLNGNITSSILLFFLPIMFGSIFQQLYNTVDAIVVGNFVGKEALGAVGGTTGTIINLLVGFVTGLSSGATVVVAQYYGSRQEEGVKKGVCATMFLAFVLGLILMSLGIAFTPTVLKWTNVPDEIFSYSVTYMRIFLCGMIPTLIYNNGAGILRAVGDSRRPLYFLVVACITNIILDILFVVVLHMGVSGVALATVISQVISAVLTMYVLACSDQAYRFSLHDFVLDTRILKRILVIGLPVGIQASLYSIANLFVQVSVNGYGTNVVAAWTAFGKIDAIFWNMSGALGQAVLTFSGQNFGAGQIDRVKKCNRISVVMYLVGAGALSSLCFFAGGFLFRLFTPDAEVIQSGMDILRMLCPTWGTFVFVEILCSSIRACGDSLVPMIMTAVGIGAFRILWILFYPDTTVFDSLLCYPISWIMTSLLFLGYYLQGGWLKRSLKQREKLMAVNRA